MEKQLLIKQLLALGWSYRQIEKETGIRRETVAKYDPKHPKKQACPHREAKAANLPTDSTQDNSAKAAKACPERSRRVPAESNQPTQKCPPTIQPTRISHAARFDAIIQEKLALGLTAQRIYQDLVVEHGFEHGYDSIKRYVRKLKKATPRVVARLHAQPGEEAQVDFGKAAPTLKDGRYVRPWFFKMVLSYSRHSYEEAVWSQDVETFIACHQRAFEAFGGVPKLIRLDNLKSGVLKANLYEPELNPLYADFAKHCGFTPLPCLPRKPEHKGKTESGVGYTKDNALKGLKFESLDAQNAHLRHWNKRWARTRIHGTTKKQVWALFVEAEQAALQPLPATAFPYFKFGIRKVHHDGHVEVDKAYYSVPHRYIGQSLNVHFNSTWVKVLDKNEVVAFHRKIQPGHFQTDKTHLPENKTLTQDEFKHQLLRRCAQIGPHCQRWAEEAIKRRHQLAFRAIQGVLRLQQIYASEKINHACQQALQLGALRYRTVALLCQDSLPARLPEAPGGQADRQAGTPQQLELLQQHELIRPIEDYQLYIDKL
jgi:transposase